MGRYSTYIRAFFTASAIIVNNNLAAGHGELRIAAYMKDVNKELWKLYLSGYGSRLSAFNGLIHAQLVEEMVCMVISLLLIFGYLKNIQIARI